MRKITVAVTAALAVCAIGAPSAHATFPGKNGKIAFVRSNDIWTMNPDGTDQVNLTHDATSELGPAWSPDGTRIAFTQGSPPKVGWMMADGSNRTLADAGTSFPNRSNPSWSPDGTRIAFTAASGLLTMNPDGSDIVDTQGRGSGHNEWSPDGSLIAAEFGSAGCHFNKLLIVHVDGSGYQTLVDVPPNDCHLNVSGVTWAPDAQRIAYYAAEEEGCPGGPCTDTGFFTVKPDGTDRQMLPAGGPDPSWSPDGTKIALSGIRVMNADATGVTDITNGSEPAWQPIPINSYPRPKGASPFRVSLVPANKPCTAPNSTHGSPLSFGSCAPPQLTSAQLTTGTPDANGLPVRMDAFVELKAIPGTSATPADEADLKIDADLNDVFTQGLSDYTGALRAALPLRITDHDNTPSPGGPGAGTTQPFQYGFDIPCTPDPAPTVGSDCSISTTADSLVPGTITESLRTVWQIGRARVDDAGPDGDPDTTGDNAVFATQGVFVP
jgi:hypothetical protein